MIYIFHLFSLIDRRPISYEEICWCVGTNTEVVSNSSIFLEVLKYKYI